MTLRAVVQYDGTNFCGMQYQPSARTVAGELEYALSALLSHSVKITSAGRTDSGVHATGQVVSWKTEATFPFERLPIAANGILPNDISIRSVQVAPNDFSARFSATERTYVYAIYNAQQPAPLLARYALRVWSAIDLDRFQAAANVLIGEHDFRSFCGVLPECGPTVRTVTVLNVRRRGDLLRVEIRADGFLHRMVRTIVGTLLECATGRRDPSGMLHILRARDRTVAGSTAPAHGLYLAGVRYTDGFESFEEPPVTASFV